MAPEKPTVKADKNKSAKANPFVYFGIVKKKLYLARQNLAGLFSLPV